MPAGEGGGNHGVRLVRACSLALPLSSPLSRAMGGERGDCCRVLLYEHTCFALHTHVCCLTHTRVLLYKHTCVLPYTHSSVFVKPHNKHRASRWLTMSRFVPPGQGFAVFELAVGCACFPSPGNLPSYQPIDPKSFQGGGGPRTRNAGISFHFDFLSHGREEHQDPVCSCAKRGTGGRTRTEW